jgi:DNA-binding response OmpR family regulator
VSQAVLIVDDSLTVRMDLASSFEKAGFRPLLCATVAEARAAVEREPVKLAVLDVILPDGDGIELLTELRGRPDGAAMAILMLSTEADVNDRIRGLKTGADEYVGKPYDARHVVAAARRHLAAGAGSGEQSVLVIDDSVSFREALGEAFEAAGYRVLKAASGEEGLDLVSDHRPGVVVVDGQLPGIDGATVIRKLRLDAALRLIPCLLLTGSDERDAELAAFEAGADAFVRKHEDIDVIVARTEAVLRSAGTERGPSGIGSLTGPHKVLAVDDSLTYLNELAEILRAEGYDVVLAHSGEEALDLLAVQPVACILLDLMMPGIGGRATCERIKSAPVLRDTPLIMLTAVEDRAAMLDGLTAGADDYISKSSEFAVLKARVRAQIRRKQFEDENRRIREELLRKEMEAAEARSARALAETRAVLVAELERKNRELEAFSYSVSHDLRAPLRAIDGFSQIVLETCADKLDADDLGNLQRVRRAARRMDELINDMLELSRVTRLEITPRRIGLGAIAQEIADDLLRQHPDRQVTFEIAGEIAVDGDERLLRIVLENLIGNAFKFTRLKEDGRIEVGASEGGCFVRDNGVGFDSSRAERLFQPFQRLHSEAQFPGTGIGLATVYRAVDRQGGRVWAESRAGEGATFFVSLPRLEERRRA